MSRNQSMLMVKMDFQCNQPRTESIKISVEISGQRLLDARTESIHSAVPQQVES
jgi:hypothetical protein